MAMVAAGGGCEEEGCCVRISLELRRNPIARRWAVVGDSDRVT